MGNSSPAAGTIGVIALLGALALAAAGVMAANTGTPERVMPAQVGGESRSAESSSDLLVLTADAGRLSDSATRLTVTGVDEEVAWFSDRPRRQVGLLTLGELVSGWSAMFATSAPNAALTHDGMAGEAAPIVLELGPPTATATGPGRTLSFPIRVLAGQPPPSETIGLRSVRLFIDPPAARLTDFRQQPMIAAWGPLRSS